MNDQTVNRILDFIDKIGIPILKIYIVLSIIGVVIVFAIVIFIIVYNFKTISDRRKTMDIFWRQGKK